MSRSIICFDQNAWIELSRAYYGNAGDTAISRLPSRLFDLANQGSHVFPISIERLHETQKNSNVERRRRLARFMIDLSDGMTIGPAYKRTIPLECRNHLIEYHNLPLKKSDIGESIIGKGISGVFGAKADLVPTKPDAQPVSPVIKEIIIDHVNGNEVLYEVISGENEQLRRGWLDDTKSIHDKAIAIMEKNLSEIPSGMSKKERHDEALSKFFRDAILPIMIEEALKLGIPLDGSIKRRKSEETPEQFLSRRIPSAYVSFELSHARDKQGGGKVIENDFNDISFLSFAIPYASIIVTERSWVQLAKRLGLEKLYGSIMLPVSKMGDLLDILSRV